MSEDDLGLYEQPRGNDKNKKAYRIRQQELNDLRFVLSSREGRRLIWRLLEYCSVFKSIWHQSALIHHNAGRQDVGHFVLGEVSAANEDAILTMMKEAKETKGEQNV